VIVRAAEKINERVRRFSGNMCNERYRAITRSSNIYGAEWSPV
jgi:hypothetical protein